MNFDELPQVRVNASPHVDRDDLWRFVTAIIDARAVQPSAESTQRATLVDVLDMMDICDRVGKPPDESWAELRGWILARLAGIAKL